MISYTLKYALKGTVGVQHGNTYSLKRIYKFCGSPAWTYWGTCLCSPKSTLMNTINQTNIGKIMLTYDQHKLQLYWTSLLSETRSHLSYIHSADSQCLQDRTHTITAISTYSFLLWSPSNRILFSHNLSRRQAWRSDKAFASTVALDCWASFWKLSTLRLRIYAVECWHLDPERSTSSARPFPTAILQNVFLSTFLMHLNLGLHEERVMSATAEERDSQQRLKRIVFNAIAICPSLSHSASVFIPVSLCMLLFSVPPSVYLFFSYSTGMKIYVICSPIDC